MKLAFDDDKWQRLQEDLNVGRLCGQNAGELYAFAKGALQRAVAAIVGEREVTPSEAVHALELLRTLRNGTHDAAQAYLAATNLVDECIKQLEPAASGRGRRRG